MWRSFLLGLMIAFQFPAFAGGDLPFPFDQENQMPVLDNRAWQALDTNLIVQVRIYQDIQRKDVQWLRAWIRGNDGFVWERLQMQFEQPKIDTDVMIGKHPGHLRVSWARAQKQGGELVIDGTRYPLEIVPMN